MKGIVSRKAGNEQICKVLSVSLAVHTYLIKDGRVQ